MKTNQNIQKGSKTRFDLQLRPSRFFYTLISGLHLLVLLIACVVDVKWWMLIIIFLIILISYFYLLSRYIYRKHKYSIIGLWHNEKLNNSHNWQLEFANNKVVDVELKPKGYLSEYLIIMHFKLKRRRQFGKLFKFFQYKTIPVIIFPDMIDRSMFVSLKRFLLGF